MITVDQLRILAKERNVIPTYNGLGMIFLSFQTQVYLFYSDETPAINHTIHEHRYSFWSTVLKGTLRNILYEYKIVEQADYMLTRKDMVKRIDYPGEVIHQHVELCNTCTFDTPSGQKYFLHDTVFHSVEPRTPKVVTFMERYDPPWKDTALFLVDKRKPYVGVFSQPMSEERCWEIIEHTLDDNN